MGRTGHHALLGGAALGLMAVGTGVVLGRGEPPLAQAGTTVRSVAHAVVVHGDGSVARARAGERLRPGDVVRTARDGTVTLQTRSRLVSLGPRGALQVIDGADQQLRTGTAVVDSQRGPGLRLQLASDTVVVAPGSATEAVRSVTTRVGQLAGGSTVTAATGRRLTLNPLAQTIVSGDALALRPTPLQLDDSALEAAAAPVLVADDEALRTLAHGIDTTSVSTAAVVAASWHGTTAAVPLPASRSEHVLPVVIADATPSAGGTPQQRYDRAAGYRRDGGSWGVVLHLLGGRSARVLATFDALDRAAPAGRVGSVSAARLVAVTTLPGAPGGGAPGGRGPGGGPSSSGRPPAGSSGGSHPTPRPSPGPVRRIVKQVGGVVGTVLGLLPHPSASARPLPPLPLPTVTAVLPRASGHR